LGLRDVIGHVTIGFPIMPFPVGWFSFGTKFLSLRVSKISNGECEAMLDMIITVCKQRSRSFILAPIDSSSRTSYRLSTVTFALGRTV